MTLNRMAKEAKLTMKGEQISIEDLVTQLERTGERIVRFDPVAGAVWTAPRGGGQTRNDVKPRALIDAEVALVDEVRRLRAMLVLMAQSPQDDEDVQSWIHWLDREWDTTDREKANTVFGVHNHTDG